MSALNNARAAAIQAAIDNLKIGPDTKERREVARAAIDDELKNTKLEHYRVSEVLIPLPTPEVGGSLTGSGDGGNGGGAAATTSLPPIDDAAVAFVDGIIRTSRDNALADAEDHWVITYDPR